MWKIVLVAASPLACLAQVPATAWGGGVGIGNGLEAHAGYQRQGWVLLGRTRYRWWGPSTGPGASWLDGMNTRSRQLEVAALGGYSVPLGPLALYGGAGLSYLNGRQLGEYRYTVKESGVLGHATYYYAYRSYQALGLPVELGLLLGRRQGSLGLAFQANINPEKTLYCGMLTCWLGRFGRATRPQP